MRETCVSNNSRGVFESGLVPYIAALCVPFYNSVEPLLAGVAPDLLIPIAGEPMPKRRVGSGMTKMSFRVHRKA
jgi:hypothetical protein